MAKLKEKKSLINTIRNLQCYLSSWLLVDFLTFLMFYKYISYKTETLVKKEYNVNYSALKDSDSEDFKEYLLNSVGMYIKPSFLLSNLIENDVECETFSEYLTNLTLDVKDEYKDKLKGLFDSLDFSKISATKNERDKVLNIILKNINNIDSKSEDVFGDFYETLLSKFSDGGVSGEFYTPPFVSKLLSLLALNKVSEEKIKGVYDPTCGSGYLLFDFFKRVKNKDITYYGQDNNNICYNLSRVNLMANGVPIDNIDIKNGDTLTNPKHNQKFEVILGNPPYNIKWEGKKNKELLKDVRYAPPGVLAPSKTADMSFILHSLYHLTDDGSCVLVLYPGVCYRKQSEEKIRKYLIENNLIDCVIQLPPNIFTNTPISTYILTFSKNKKTKDILFVDTTKLSEVDENNRNFINDDNLEKILKAINERKTVKGFTYLASHEDIEENEYNLTVSYYIETENVQEVINIEELEKELKELKIAMIENFKEMEGLLKDIKA